MSIKAMSFVWDYSTQRASHLLMLLAIADFADDDGIAYPGVARLAKKTRMSERNAKGILRSLEKSGELSIQLNAGVSTSHGSTNRYVLIQYQNSLALPGASSNTSGDKTRNSSNGVKKRSPQGVLETSPKPSVEPSVKESAVRPHATPNYSDPAFQERYLYYRAFEQGFPPDARPKLEDTKKNRETAQFLYANGYQVLDVITLVQSKIEAGSVDYRFIYLQEDMPKQRLAELRGEGVIGKPAPRLPPLLQPGVHIVDFVKVIETMEDFDT